jgi:secreted trypsin-like serine protease
MKKLNSLHFITSLFIATFMGCADQKPVNSKVENKDNSHIVGGKDLKYSSATASSVVFISTENDRGHNEICTGTFISKSLILTAAHCIAKDKDGMSISFRLKDYATTQNIVDVEIVEVYKLDFSDLGVTRNDMGIIQFKGGLPQGATIAYLPKQNNDQDVKPQVLTFSAVGYGRNTGLKSDDPMTPNGEGVLRIKSLASEPVSPLMDIFKIDQYKNKGGVCFGDSGGPALMKDTKTNKTIIVGIASAVLTQRTGGGINADDDCQNESMYMNMYFYVKYFNKYLKAAIAAKDNTKNSFPDFKKVQDSIY